MRRIEALTRANTSIVSWDAKHGLAKINLLAFWSDEYVEAYQVKYDLPRNPLVAQGYPSIGVHPARAGSPLAKTSGLDAGPATTRQNAEFTNDGHQQTGKRSRGRTKG